MKEQGTPSHPGTLAPVGEAARQPGRPPKELTGMEKVMWWVLVFLSALWIMWLEPTDAVPVVGWMDEVVALFILTTSLDRLGIEIPFLTKFLRKRTGIGQKEAAEKDVTPPRA